MSTTRSIRPRSPGARFPVIRAVRPGGAARDGLALPMPPEWTRDALCAQTAPDAFFPEKGEATAPAKRICARCPVTAECLAYALANRERFGIWGGKSERERRALATRQRRGRPVWRTDADVARLTTAGWTAAQIAEELGITDRTVCRARARLRNSDAPTTRTERAA